MGRSNEVADKLEAYIKEARDRGMTDIELLTPIVDKLRSGEIADDDPRVLASERTMDAFHSSIAGFKSGKLDASTLEGLNQMKEEGKQIAEQALAEGNYQVLELLSEKMQLLDRVMGQVALKIMLGEPKTEKPAEEEWPTEVH